MARTSSSEPTATGSEAELLASSHLLQSHEIESEMQELAAAVRTQVRWLEAGGVTGLPRPQRRPPRIAAAMPAGPAQTPAAAPPRASESLPDAATPRPLAPPAARSPLPVPAPAPALQATQSAVLTEAVYPELPELTSLHGQAGLATLRRALGDCRRCKLCHARNNIVFDDGTADAWLAFVGEGPGADEDRLGKPFVGAAGQLLDRMIDAMAAEARKRGSEELAQHLHRSAVYICNVVKCRPPGNRTPENDEVAACAPFLRGQLYSLRPTLRVIVALGRTPTQYLLKTTAAIGSLRGRFSVWEGIPVMPTYHPAYLLRTPSAKRQVWEDLQMVLEALRASSP